MKVLLTGASGFVGSHILDRLRAEGLSTAILLRPSSDRQFIEPHLGSIEVRSGSLSEPETLKPALAGITHVIHCAGVTRARRNSDYFEGNHAATRSLVQAANAFGQGLQRFVHISSLSVGGPSQDGCAATEDDPPRPISVYGRSKAAAEKEVRDNCQVPFTVLRPPVVYGPRDRAFLPLFRTAHRHFLPRSNPGQRLSLVFAPDLAKAVVGCLQRPVAAAKTYYVASPEVTTAAALTRQVALELHRWTVPLPVPAALLWMVCLAQETVSRLTGKPALLNLQKYAELSAPGWVCDPSRLERETGIVCGTTLAQGLAQTLAWYREHRWL